MRLFLCCVISLFMFSCVPVSIAPHIKTHKVAKAKRFKRDLPKNHGFIFRDPKDVDEFYEFVTAKYDLGTYDHDNPPQISFLINGQEYFMAIYEREKVTTTVNLAPILVDASLESKNLDPVFENSYTTRKGKWYIILVITNSQGEDALHGSYRENQNVINYLANLKQEYLTTHDYVRAYLKRNQ